MTIYYGYKTKEKQLLKGKLLDCKSCNSQASVGVYSSQRWFTLFDITIFPISKPEYFRMCKECTVGVTLTKEEADSLLAADTTATA